MDAKMENWTPEANVPPDKPHPRFLTTIFGKKGEAYLQLFKVNQLDYLSTIRLR